MNDQMLFELFLSTGQTQQTIGALDSEGNPILLGYVDEEGSFYVDELGDTLVDF